jgi:hypothetical protein
LHLDSKKSKSILKGSNQYIFLNLTRELEPPGTFQTEFETEFAFNQLEFGQDTYYGQNLELTYRLQVEMNY